MRPFTGASFVTRPTPQAPDRFPPQPVEAAMASISSRDRRDSSRVMTPSRSKRRTLAVSRAVSSRISSLPVEVHDDVARLRQPEAAAPADRDRLDGAARAEELRHHRGVDAAAELRDEESDAGRAHLGNAGAGPVDEGDHGLGGGLVDVDGVGRPEPGGDREREVHPAAGLVEAGGSSPPGGSPRADGRRFAAEAHAPQTEEVGHRFPGRRPEAQHGQHEDDEGGGGRQQDPAAGDRGCRGCAGRSPRLSQPEPDGGRQVGSGPERRAVPRDPAGLARDQPWVASEDWVAGWSGRAWRRRPSARARRDLTVPGRHDIAVAISASDSPTKYR